jgi:hypothetical protein
MANDEHLVPLNENFSATVFLDKPIFLGIELMTRIVEHNRFDLVPLLNITEQIAPDISLQIKGPDYTIMMLQVRTAMRESMWRPYVQEDPLFLQEGAAHVAGHTSHLMTYANATTKEGKVRGALVLSQIIALLAPRAVLWCPAYKLSSGKAFGWILEKLLPANQLPLPVWCRFGVEQVSQSPSLARVTTVGLGHVLGHEVRTPPRPANDAHMAVFDANNLLSWIVTGANPLKAGDTMGVEGTEHFFRIEAAGLVEGVPLLSINPGQVTAQDQVRMENPATATDPRAGEQRVAGLFSGLFRRR